MGILSKAVQLLWTSTERNRLGESEQPSDAAIDRNVDSVLNTVVRVEI